MPDDVEYKVLYPVDYFRDTGQVPPWQLNFLFTGCHYSTKTRVSHLPLSRNINLNNKHTLGVFSVDWRTSRGNNGDNRQVTQARAREMMMIVWWLNGWSSVNDEGDEWLYVSMDWGAGRGGKKVWVTDRLPKPDDEEKRKRKRWRGRAAIYAWKLVKWWSRLSSDLSRFTITSLQDNHITNNSRR